MFEKRLKKLLCLFVFLFVLGSGATDISAVTGSYFSYDKVPQEKSMWCWAASAENAVQWEMKISRHQKDAVRKIKGSIFNKYPNVGGSLSDTVKAAEYISENKEDYACTKLSTTDAKPYSFLKREIQDYSNVIVLFGGYYDGNERTGGHAITCHGYYEKNNVKYLWIYDPWDGGDERKLPYSQLVNGYGGRRYDGTVFNMEKK
ncbi:MAG: hypothetical protein E7282_04290 [Lachnospiraceae bacterium]|nr:hypothetical protein [Lachnospiraceae bacterium]